MRDDLGRCHFVEQRLQHAKSEPFVPKRQVEAAAVGITFFDAADIPERLILGIDGRRQFDAELIPRAGRIWCEFPQLAKYIGDRIGQPLSFALIVKARDSFHDGGFLNLEHKITQSGHDTNLYKHSLTAARFRLMSDDSILRYTDLAALIQMARARNWPTIRIVRAMSSGLTYADALKLARKAAPLLDITVSEFMRLRKND